MGDRVEGLHGFWSDTYEGEGVDGFSEEVRMKYGELPSEQGVVSCEAGQRSSDVGQNLILYFEVKGGAYVLVGF